MNETTKPAGLPDWIKDHPRPVYRDRRRGRLPVGRELGRRNGNGAHAAADDRRTQIRQNHDHAAHLRPIRAGLCGGRLERGRPGPSGLVPEPGRQPASSRSSEGAEVRGACAHGPTRRSAGRCGPRWWKSYGPYAQVPDQDRAPNSGGDIAARRGFESFIALRRPRAESPRAESRALRFRALRRFRAEIVGSALTRAAAACASRASRGRSRWRRRVAAGEDCATE